MVALLKAYIYYLYPGCHICLTVGRFSLFFFEGLSGDFMLIYHSFIDHNVVRTDTHRFALLFSLMNTHSHCFGCRLLRSPVSAGATMSILRPRFPMQTRRRRTKLATNSIGQGQPSYPRPEVESSFVLKRNAPTC